MSLETIVAIVFLVATAIYLLIRDGDVNSVARVTAGVAAALWAVVMLVPGL